MWCRVITGEKAGEALPITWRQAGTEWRNVLSEAPRQLYSDPASDETRHVSEDMERSFSEAHQRGFREGEAAATHKWQMR